MLARAGARRCDRRSRDHSCIGRATILARRLDGANRAHIQLKSQLQVGNPHTVTEETVEKIEELLGPSGGNLVYAGYPYDPFA
jgi:hypothetical protein